MRSLVCPAKVLPVYGECAWGIAHVEDYITATIMHEDCFIRAFPRLVMPA